MSDERDDDAGEAAPAEDQPREILDLIERAEQAYVRWCNENQLTPAPVHGQFVQADAGDEVVLRDVNDNRVATYRVKNGHLRRIGPVMLPD